MTSWLDRIAYELLHAEHEVREALRAASRQGGPSAVSTTAGRGWQTITMGIGQARALLRGAMPAPIAATKLRAPHAQLAAALEVFALHMLAMNDPLHPPEVPLAAAADLAEELADWMEVVRWRAASRKAGIMGRMWPAPGAGRTEKPFPVHTLPNAKAGFRELARYSRLPSPREMARIEASAGQESGQVIDFRQDDLPFAPIAKQRTG